MSPGAREVDDELEPDESDDDASARSPRRSVRRVADEGSYVCGSCGEEIVVPLDRTGGEQQEYVEDCPVCCVPNEIHVDFDDDGSARVWARPE